VNMPVATKSLRAQVSKGGNAVVRAYCRIVGCEEPGASTKTEPPATATVADVPAADTAVDTPVVRGETTTAPAMLARGLSKTYPGGVVGARDINIEAHSGEIVAVVGPNGAGKSTTLNMISGLLRPTGGTATVHGVPSTDVKRLGAVLGVALQTSGLDPTMTAKEHFQTQAALYGVPRDLAETCATNLLEMFGLTSYTDRQVAQFSIGLQRRLVLALSMLHDPPVIILDEPTAGLDPQSRRMVWDLLERLRGEGRTIIFSTQLLEEADLLAQRMYVIADGHVVAEGPPSELREAYGELMIKLRVAGSLDEVARLLAAKARHLGAGRRENDYLVFTTTQDSYDVEDLMAVIKDNGIELLELSVGRPSLEDAFVRLTGAMIRDEPLLGMGAMGGPLCRCS